MTVRLLSFVMAFTFALSAHADEPEPEWGEGCVKKTGCKRRSDHLPVCKETKQQRVWIDDLLADPQKYDGKKILVGGSIGKGPSKCTKKACKKSAPCCNTCSAPVVLKGDKVKGFVILENASSAEQLTCTGDESWLCCALLVVDHLARATGTVAIDGGQVTLRDATACQM